MNELSACKSKTIILCDSIDTVRSAREQGLSDEITIYTSSPALMRSGLSNIKYLEDRWNIDRFREFQTSIAVTAKKIFDFVFDISQGDRELALVTAQKWVAFNKIIYKVSCISDLYCNGQVVEIRPGRSNVLVNNFPWEKVLGEKFRFIDVFDNNVSNVSLRLKRVWLNIHKFNKKLTNFLVRLYRADRHSMQYRMHLLLSKINYIPRNKNILIYKENDLLIESAAYSAKAGFSLREISSTSSKNKITVHGGVDFIDRLDNLVANDCLQWLPPFFSYALKDYFIELLIDETRVYYESIEHWRSVLSGYDSSNAVVFTGGHYGPIGIALYRECKKRKIPVVSFSHGCGVALSKLHDEMSVGFDVNTSDLFIAYSDGLAEAQSRSQYAVSKNIVSGMSQRHHKMISRSTTDSDKVLYISTTLYKGNVGQFVSWVRDNDRTQFEIDLIDEVFSKSEKKIDYKLYPAEQRRYLDQDPIISNLLGVKNIEIISDGLDLRYMTFDYSLIITSRPTSTIGWLLHLDIPLIYIANENDMPLNDEAYDLLSKAVFLVNTSSENYMDELNFILNSSKEYHSKRWRKMEADRQIFIDKYISANVSKFSGEMVSEMISSFF